MFGVEHLELSEENQWGQGLTFDFYLSYRFREIIFHA